MLRQAVLGLPVSGDPNLLVGFSKADDAGVYKLRDDLALVQTVDFFTPIVDDPRWYGRIAAANSLSDVYAMGGKPLTALNILCYPEEMGPEVLQEILQGALEKLQEAQCVLLGGHSVKDPELKFGFSVTGTIHPSRVFSNEKALPNQAIVLTKPLGTGIVSTAAKKEKAPADLLNLAMAQMATLNNKALEVVLKTSASTCTDVTGFGFLGHLGEVCRASNLGARIHSNKIPSIPGLESFIRDEFLTRGDWINREYIEDILDIQSGVLESQMSLMLDPQTSGGLLVFLPHEDTDKLLKALAGFGQQGWIVGETFASPRPQIQVI